MVDLAISNLTKEFPALRGIEVAASWGALIDTAPDLVPIISTVDGLSGLVIASGFSGHGFGIGPVAAFSRASWRPEIRPASIRAPIDLLASATGQQSAVLR